MQMKEKLSIDGGCDASLVRGSFIIKSTTNRSVDVQGIIDVIKIESLPIVSAFTAIDLEEKTIILNLHGCISAKDNQTSIFFKLEKVG